jgi:N-terminal half of MaoC dehydratase
VIVSTENVGRVVMTVELPIERGKIREFARAVHTANAIYYDVDVARAMGFGDVPTPPTFTAVAAHYAGDAHGIEGTMSAARAVTEALGLDVSRTVNGQQSWEFERIPTAGDILTGTTLITGIEHKIGRRGGASTFVTALTTYRDAGGQVVLRETVTVVELGS